MKYSTSLRVLVHLLAVFVENVFAHEIRAFEFLAGQRAQPLVLGQLLRVGPRYLLKRNSEKSRKDWKDNNN